MTVLATLVPKQTRTNIVRAFIAAGLSEQDAVRAMTAICAGDVAGVEVKSNG